MWKELTVDTVVCRNPPEAWRRVLLEKLIVAQLVNKSPFRPYGTCRSIAVFERVCYWPLSWPRWTNSTNFHPYLLTYLLHGVGYNL